MKLKFILFLILFSTSFKIFAQLPSIKETNNFSFDKNRDLQNLQIERTKQNIKLLKSKINSLNKTNKLKADSLMQEIDQRADTLKVLRKHRIYPNYEKYYNTIAIQAKKDSIENYYKLLDEVKYNKKLSSIDSIAKFIFKKEQQMVALVLKRDEKLATLGKFHWILPSWRREDRKNFFSDMYDNKTDETNYLNAFALNGNSDGTTVQTEIVTDNLYALRVSFGSVLSVATAQKEEAKTIEEAQIQNKKETEQETFNRLINGGGNFYLEGILPLASTNQNNGTQITLYTYANVRGAMDLENFNSDIDTSTVNGSVGLNSYLAINSDNKKFGFFIVGDVNFVLGSNAFYKNLGFTNPEGFLVGKIVAGLSILSRFKVSANILTFGSNEAIRNNKVIVGVQIFPGF